MSLPTLESILYDDYLALQAARNYLRDYLEDLRTGHEPAPTVPQLIARLEPLYAFIEEELQIEKW